MVRRSSPRGGCVMSPLTRSKPVSENSRATGMTDAPDPPAREGDATASPKDSDKARDRAGRRAPLEIELEVSRQRSAGWTIFGLVVGALLVWKLGTVAMWAGVALIVAGLYHAWQLLRTFRYPPGTIVVSDREVTLPR